MQIILMWTLILNLKKHRQCGKNVRFIPNSKDFIIIPSKTILMTQYNQNKLIMGLVRKEMVKTKNIDS